MHILPSDQYSLKNTPFDLALDFPITVLPDGYVSDVPVTYLHTHNCLEIGFCHEGTGVFLIGDKMSPFGKGDASFVFPDKPHYGQATPGTSSRWTWVLLDPVSLLGGLPGGDAAQVANICKGDFSNVLGTGDQLELVRMIECLVSELITQKAGHASIARALVWAILVKLNQVQKKMGIETVERKGLSRITPALNFVAQHYMQNISLAQLAGVCNVSVTYFRRLFVGAIGKRPLDYVTSFRMQMADALLEQTDKSILEISLAVGYPSLSSFNRQFHRHFEASPRERRNAGR